MPKRTDIQSIMIIGAGPIIIGQACEFDYSGTQAVKALKEEGYRVILVNSNPATIMTDPNMADATYVEPITPDMVAKVIEKERPDALLPTMGGQTALNTALALADDGTLEKFNVELIGANQEAINKAEDRDLFRQAMTKIGLDMPRSAIAHNNEEAQKALDEIGLPLIIRPSFTMGGTGGGIAETEEEYWNIIESGLDASPTTEVLVEESILGWKEYEMEVVRDKNDNGIIICSIENVDPMGIHTGDSITVAPALTLTDKEYQIMRNASLAVLREIGVETGGSNVQFAVNPKNGRLIVIEMNPRVSRSSALASKATGFPIAKVAARLAVGYTLDELANDITGVTPASFEPTIDYVVTKIPRFTFEKFAGAKQELNTSMKSVGEAMSVGRTFQESVQKAYRSLETGQNGLNPVDLDLEEGQERLPVLLDLLTERCPDRLLVVADALREGATVEQVVDACKFDPWFVERIKEITDAEHDVVKNGLPQERRALTQLKSLGFSDERLAELVGQKASDVYDLRNKLDVHTTFKRIDTCAAEFEGQTAYFYSCYEGDGLFEPECEANPSDRKKVMILGGGPNRIGQGIEFDYCCVHAAYALEEAGYETIMVNCNPETVSTDYDTSDRLYFEPLTVETVLEICRTEMKNGTLHGVIVQYGGQTPLKLAHGLEAAGIPILGTSPDAIDLAEDRERFQVLLNDLKLKQPANGTAFKADEAAKIAESIGYPVVIRPSYVLGGRAMEIVHSTEQLHRYMKHAVKVTGDNPVLIDGYLENAIEVDVDAICDGESVFVAGIMQHIEEAGIHSGDSACSLPPYSLSEMVLAELQRQTEKLAIALKVRGLMNVQFAVKDEVVYLLEVNPRASRTVPFVAKTIGYPLAKIASRIMAGETLADFNLESKHLNLNHIAVKEAVFPFTRFPGVDVLLGPEMKSTGEVMGLDRDFARAFAKAQLAAGTKLPTEGTVFVSVKDRDKAAIVPSVRRLFELGFKIVATEGTAAFLNEQDITTEVVRKVQEGSPHIVDMMEEGKVDLLFNTTEGAKAIEDSKCIRQAALLNSIPYYTTIAGSWAATEAIRMLGSGKLEVEALQVYAA